MKKVTYFVVLRERLTGYETTDIVDTRKVCFRRASYLATFMVGYDVIVRKHVVSIDDVVFKSNCYE